MEPSLVILSIILIIWIFSYLVSFNLWLTAIFSGVKITLWEMIFMKIRKAPIKNVINSLIVSHKSGFPINIIELEAHGLAGGNVTNATKAYIKCRIDDVDITFNEICKDDLSGKKYTEIVNTRKEQIDIDDLRKSISKKILLELSDDQVKQVDKFLTTSV